MPTEADRKRILTEMSAVTVCPVLWDESDRLYDVVEWLHRVWVETVQDHEVRGESRWFDEREFSISETEELDEIASDLENIRSWISAARRAYLRRTRRFWDIKLADSAKYPKHFAKANQKSLQAIRDWSRKKKESCLYPGIDAEDLSAALWMGLSDIVSDLHKRSADAPARASLSKKILTEPKARIAFATTIPVGAVNGLDAKHIAYEIGGDGTVHAYPIEEYEATRMMPGITLPVLDDLEGAHNQRHGNGKRTPRPWGCPKKFS